MPPDNLATHLQSLLGLSRSSQPPIESTYPDLLSSWRASGLPVTIDGDSADANVNNEGDASFELELPPGIPLPTLLDYYTPLADAARLDEGIGGVGVGGSGSGVRFAETEEEFSGPDGPARSLTSRLKNQCGSDSTFKKLLDLLSSTLPSPELQDPLMSLFSYDPSSFDLISEIFCTPSMRQQILTHARGANGMRASAEEFVPPVGALSGVVNPVIGGLGLGSREEAEERISRQLEENANRPLWTGENNVPEAIQYPHVYTSQTASAVTSYGGRLALPLGHMTRRSEIAEEVIIPPANPIPPRSTERLIQVKELGPLAAGCFPGYQCLNRIQSIIQPTAMGSNENMLVCAPTGAGKTDVAVMTILRVLGQHLREPVRYPFGPDSIRKDDFKVIYVAPMKALAAEITRKVGKRLAWLGIQVRELTGDMQLSRKEINETQIIVTTPEKWDVVTRKPTGEGELASKVKLLIIDEVHLLNEERGAVIETIVARTLRLVESSQTLIRIVGLSATLPNYIDVSDFLRVNRYQGLFFFDSSFRPVPLEQNFIGVVGKVRSEKSKKNMDQVVFDKVAENINAGHQVMVFVHARKDTVKTAEKLKEMAQMEGDPVNFDPRTHPQFDFFRREIGMSRNKEMKQLFDYGFGIHHAGMLRSDRNMMERMFEANCIKVLVCTATLAWGVNLPAHAVVIKGTQVYDAGKGNFVDLSILDVLQIFGRAGRPGYESSGVGYICTTADKLDHYLHAVLAQHPIESKFVPGMLDAMNAEISLGTIANVSEAIEWLGYTYLFVRMKRNPFVYGMAHDETAEDPHLGRKREGLVDGAGKRLAEIRMAHFDQFQNTFTITDLGRIAAKYYIRHETVEVFNSHFKAKMTEADTLALLSMSTEFHQLQVRENELPELAALMTDIVPCQVKGGTDTQEGKVSILLQAYICRAHIEDFALVSDTAYVAQNAGRIIRALLEIALSRKWGNAAAVLASMSKSIEKQMWSFQNPLRQSRLQQQTLWQLEKYADEYSPSELAAMTPQQIGDLIKSNDRHGLSILTAAKQFPIIAVDFELRPLTHDLLQINLKLERKFVWNQNLHGYVEHFWVWVEDSDSCDIYQYQSVVFRPSTSSIHLEIVVPIRSVMPPSFTARVISDKWVGSDEEVEISLAGLMLPPEPLPTTPLLDIPYLSLSNSLKTLGFDTGYPDRFNTFNAIQSQVFWPLYHSDGSFLLTAPGGSGKSTIADAATWRALRNNGKSKILYLSPGRSFASETIARLKDLTLRGTHVQVRSLEIEAHYHQYKQQSPCVGVATPAELLTSLITVPDFLDRVDLFILDDLQMLDAAYELAIIQIMLASKYSTARIVALSASLHDAYSLADWLRIPDEGIYTFKATDRALPLTTSVQPYSISNSAILLKSMVKPVYASIKTSLPGPTIVFVPSSGACKTVAADLITQSGMEIDLNGFLGTPRETLEGGLRMKNPALLEPLLHGIGIYHDGLHSRDMSTVLQLFAAEAIRVLIVSRESCWTLPTYLTASNVVVMGAQYLELDTSKPGGVPERRTKNYTVLELTRMQGFATRPSHPNSTVSASGSRRFTVMCQAEQKDTYNRFLNEGLPLESAFKPVLSMQSDLVVSVALQELLGDEPKRQDLVDLLGWSYFWVRLRNNPNYYDMNGDVESGRSLSRAVDGYFEEYYKRRRAAGGPDARGLKGEELLDRLGNGSDELSGKQNGTVNGATHSNNGAHAEVTVESGDDEAGDEQQGNTYGDGEGETSGEEADAETE